MYKAGDLVYCCKVVIDFKTPSYYNDFAGKIFPVAHYCAGDTYPITIIVEKGLDGYNQVLHYKENEVFPAELIGKPIMKLLFNF